MACGLLSPGWRQKRTRRLLLQFTIESRKLTSDSRHRSSVDTNTRQTTVEADDAVEAITQFIRGSDIELVSLARPGGGGESIATLKKEDVVFLARVYAA